MPSCNVLYSLGKCLTHQQREDDSGIRTHFDWPRIHPDLSPAHCLVRLGTAVTAIKFLSGVDVDSKVCAIAHEIGVADVVLGHTWEEVLQHTCMPINSQYTNVWYQKIIQHTTSQVGARGYIAPLACFARTAVGWSARVPPPKMIMPVFRGAALMAS